MLDGGRVVGYAQRAGARLVTAVGGLESHRIFILTRGETVKESL